MLVAAVLCVGLLCAGIGLGSAYTFFFAFNPSHSTPAFWVAGLQHAIVHAGVPLFVVQPVAFACCVALAVLQRDQPSGFWFSAAAGGALLIAALVTRLGHIPINVAMKNWKPDALTGDQLAQIRRWWVLHIARFAALLVGFGSLILSAVPLVR